VDPQCLGQCVVDRDAVVTKLLPQCLFILGLVEVGWRRCPCSRCATATSGAGGAEWDVEASAPCAGRCDITQPASHITSAFGARLGADPGHPLD
jgi:hypothetical protein